MKRAIIIGVTGQDGSYLAEFLLEKGYEVHGVVRRASLFNTDRIDHLYHDPHMAGLPLSLHYGDLTDTSSIRGILEDVRPVEVYNLGAQSHVMVSFEQPLYRTAKSPGVFRTADSRNVGAATGRTQVAKSATSRPSFKSSTISRGGFGASARRYGSAAA